MAEVTISNQDWERLKLKLKRKYNHLTEEDLAYQPGQEDALIEHLQQRLNRKRDYIIFTLKKGMVSLETNRL